MPDLTRQMLKCYLTAKHVDHYYWMHTVPDSGDRIHIENVQKVVGLMSKMDIEKKIVNVPNNPYRGYIERYADRAVIWINEDQSVSPGREYEIVPWQKHSTIKELCHVLLDGPDSYEPDPDATLMQMFQYKGPFLGQNMSATLMSENLAEVLAMEIHYPLEYRKEDRAFLDGNGDIKSVVINRQVPEIIIQNGVDPEYIKICNDIWSELTQMETPPLEE